MTPAPIVGLMGLAGSGKSTAAAHLEGLGYVRTRFAKPLKDMLRAFLATVGTSPADVERMIEGDLKEAPCAVLGGHTPRYAMQTLGTEWGRDLLKLSLWTDAWTTTCRKAIEDGAAGVVVEDCRFANEVDAIRAMGGFALRIQRGASAAAGDHPSERQDAEPDMIIRNDGTPAILGIRVEGAIERLAQFRGLRAA